MPNRIRICAAFRPPKRTIIYQNDAPGRGRHDCSDQIGLIVAPPQRAGGRMIEFACDLKKHAI
jgi:hypothetical protein